MAAVHLAILNDKSRIVKQLLDCGANPTSKAPNGYRPLHLACQWGSKLILSHIIIGLLENSSNFQLNEKTENGKDPLDLVLNLLEANSFRKVD